MSPPGIAEASGRAFLGIIGQIKERHGAAAIKRVVDAMEASAQGMFEGRLSARKWYAYSAYAALLRAVERVFGHGDGQLARALGVAAGERDLGSIFKLYVMMASPERLIRSCARIWPVYYRNAGRMEALAWAPEHTVLRISEFQDMEPMHCRLMEGWMVSTMAQIGCRVSDSGRESTCMSSGGAYHEFTCTWVARSPHGS